MIIRLEQNERTVHWAEDRDIQSEIIIGRSADCSWRLASADRSVGRRHAALHRQGNEIWIRDLGSLNGLRFGDESIRSRRLVSGDRIRLGDALLVVEDGPADPASGAGSTRVLQLAELRWNPPVNGQHSTPILSFPCIVGSGEGTGLRVRDKFVSREHAVIDLGPDGKVTLADLGSRNGTRVNGQLLNEGRLHRLRNGDVIQFGRYRAEFCEADPADAVAANRFVRGQGRVRPVLKVGTIVLAAVTFTLCILAVGRFWPSAPGKNRSPAELSFTIDPHGVQPSATGTTASTVPVPVGHVSPKSQTDSASFPANRLKEVAAVPPESAQPPPARGGVAAGILPALPPNVEAALAALTNRPPQCEPARQAVDQALGSVEGKTRERLDGIGKSLTLIEADMKTLREYVPRLCALNTQDLDEVRLKTERPDVLEPHPQIQMAADSLRRRFQELNAQAAGVRTHVNAFKVRRLALEKAFPQGLKTWGDVVPLGRALDGDGLDRPPSNKAVTGDVPYRIYFGSTFLHRAMSGLAGQQAVQAADSDDRDEPATLLHLSMEAARAADDALAFFDRPLNEPLQCGAIAEQTLEMRQFALDRDAVVASLGDIAARSKGRRRLIASGAALLLQGKAGVNTPAAEAFAAQWRDQANAVSVLSDRCRRASGAEREAMEDELRAQALPGDPALRSR